MPSKNIYTSPLCSCVTCRKLCSQKGIHSHYISAHTNDGNIRRKDSGRKGRACQINAYTPKPKRYRNNCLVCGEPCKKKFCGHRCAATFTNKQRKDNGYSVSTATKQKISEAFKEIVLAYSKVSSCINCGKFSKGRKKRCAVCQKVYISQITRENANTRYARGDMFGSFANNKKFGIYNSPIAGPVRLDSSYELRVATALDNNNVKWVRPGPLTWVDENNVSHRYFPDFYLVEFNVYLDPKNDFLIKRDSDKIKRVSEQNSVTVVVLDKDTLSWEAILENIT